MKIISLVSLVIMLAGCAALASCATPTGYNPNSSVLYGTANAVAAQETAGSYRVTSTAGAVMAQATGTAVAATQQAQSAASATAEAIAVQTTATSESLSFRATEQAISSQATYSSIAAGATGTAVYQAAQVEQRLIADEAARLANQRQSEQVWLIAKITAFVLFVLGVTVALVLFAYGRYNLSRPVEFDGGDGRKTMALPSGQYQVMPARPLALPAPQPPEINAEPIQLPRLESGHVMIVGVTGDGKSMALREIVAHRDNTTVLDPHDTPGAWGRANVIGGGRNFEAIRHFMAWMQDELNRRAQARAGGQRQFDKMTVATEEMPAIMKAGGHEIRDTWQMWMREGRKFGLFMVVVSQSTRVETLGIKGEGDLLENFDHVIELATSAVKHYPDLVAGMERPAVLRSRIRTQPVIIPYDPRRDPESPLFLTAGHQVHQPPQEIIDIDGIPVSPAMIQEIISMKRNGASGRAIERAVMGYEGGQAYKIVAAVLEQYFDAVNGRFPAIQ